MRRTGHIFQKRGLREVAWRSEILYREIHCLNNLLPLDFLLINKIIIILIIEVIILIKYHIQAKLVFRISLRRPCRTGARRIQNENVHSRNRYTHDSGVTAKRVTTIILLLFWKYLI